MDKVLVLQAKRFAFKDEQTGRQIEGVKVTYVSNDNSTSNDSKGVDIITASGDYSVYNDFTSVPAVYELDFALRPGRNNRPEVRLASAKFVKVFEGLKP